MSNQNTQTQHINLTSQNISNISYQFDFQQTFSQQLKIQKQSSSLLKIFFHYLQQSSLKEIFLNWVKNDLAQSQAIKNTHYLTLWNNVNIEQRSKVLQKLIALHRKLKLKNVVLFHSVKVLDNYLLKESYKQQINYHLLPINCLLISHKHFSMRRIKISKWLQILEVQQKQYSTQLIVQNQGRILAVLGFNIQFPISFQISSLLSSTLKLSQKSHMFMRYLLQLSFFLQPYQFNQKHNPFLVGVSCFHLSCFFLQPQLWNNAYLQPFKISVEGMQQFCGQLFTILMKAKQDPSLEAVYNKFKKSSYKNVADIKFEKLQGPQEQNRQKISIGTPQTCCDQDSNQTNIQCFNQASQSFYPFLKDSLNIKDNQERRSLKKLTRDEKAICDKHSVKSENAF